MHEERRARDRVLGVADLLERLRGVRAAGGRVVFTNGCFDLLHAGHLYLLEEAAALGDCLVVGINSDESVRRLKGTGRPLVGQEERALMLAGLRPVDWVVVFEEDTPLRLIETLLPEVLIKGADYALEAIVGREVVEARGGRVVSLPLLPGRSTSALVDALRRGRP
jgi:rfaE bifunctional protein nucleotidyltransferase chain/domain